MAFAINWPPSNSYTTFRWATITGTRSYLQFLLQKNGLGATIARSLQNFFGDSKYLFRPLGFARDKKAGLTWAVLLRRMALGFTVRSFPAGAGICDRIFSDALRMTTFLFLGGGTA